tara:strand:+ start:1006 stop:1929 length:924 start_codon:yes stop_codon:yes gene_type:complete
MSYFYSYLSILILIISNSFAIEIKIALKIDNEIITNLDIKKEGRYLSSLNTNFSNLSSDQIYEISKNSLVREKIKEKYISKFFEQTVIEEKTLNNYIMNLFNKLNLKSIEEFENYLNKNNLNLNYVKNKINIELMWNRLIYYKYKSKLKIDEDEIKKELSNTKIIQSKKFFLQEILFEIKEKEKISEKYQKIKNEIFNSSFGKAALLYSLSDTSTNNGNIGWINQSSLNQNILKKINVLNVGDISNPITVPGGFLILKIKEVEIERKNIDIEKELQKIIKSKTNQQLNQYSLIFYNKIKKDILINEL